MKKMLLVLLLLLCTMLPVMAEETSEFFECDGYQYVLQPDGTAKIVELLEWFSPSDSFPSYNSSSGELIIPDELDGHPVTSISGTPFLHCLWSPSHITLPEGLTSIELSTLCYSPSLKSITLPNSLTDLSFNPFVGCDQLTDIIVSPNHPTLEVIDGVLYNKAEKMLLTYPEVFQSKEYIIPAGTLAIGKGAFYENKVLESITLPDSLKSIGDYAFNQCELLTDITLPYGLTEIGNFAFCYCKKLNSIFLPDSLQKMGYNPFIGCEKLKSINFSPIHPVFSLSDGILFNKESKELVCYTPAFNSSKYTVPQGTLSIGGYAFSDCKKLTNITLPDSVTSIEDSAFEYCSKLKDISLPDSITSIGSSSFFECENLKSIVLPSNLSVLEPSTFSGCRNLNSVSLPDTLTTINPSAFSNCVKLENITLPKSVTFVGEGAFRNCSSLTSIALPEGITSLYGSTFSGCKNLNSVSLPDTLTTVNHSVFSNCVKLENITLPKSVTFVGEGAFSNCSSLTSIALPEGITSLYGSTFSGCKKLESISLPDSLTSIGSYEFNNCSRLSELILPEGLTSIGDEAFHACLNLTQLSLSANVTFIGNAAFSDCSKLNNIAVSPDNPVYITVNGVLFDKVEKSLLRYPSGCTHNSYVVPAGTLSIGDNAFEHSSHLRHISLPKGLISIGNDAFSFSGLESISVHVDWSDFENLAGSPLPGKNVLPRSLQTIGYSAFYSCINLKEIILHEGITEIRYNAFNIGILPRNIYVPHDSYAEKFLTDSKISFKYIEEQ